MRYLAALVLVLASLLVPTPVVAVPDPCIGAPAGSPATYPEQRQFVENQAWWMPTGSQPDTAATHHGHAHMGACIPERENLTDSTVTFNVRVMLHDNPGTFNYVSLVFKGTDYETTVKKCYVRSVMTDYTCPSASSSGKGDLKCAQPATCERWLTFTVPTSSFQHSGLQEIRMRGFIPEPDGKEMRTNLNFQTTVSNGKSSASVSRQPYLRSKGWYTDTLYCESAYRSVPLPDGPVPDLWSPTLGQVTHSSDASLPVTHSFISIDPDFHAEPPRTGTVLRDVALPYGPLPTPIVTTTLSNGVHRLYQKAECRDTAQQSTNSGVLVVPFQVAN